MVQVVAITGPTASGKSALADEVALRVGTDVISADAMQVYRGMDIGTAKTPMAERAVPLQLVDIVDPDQAYSAALYQRDARDLIDNHIETGKLAILCGGTGLYIQAALEDMRFPQGEVDDARRTRYNDMAESLGAAGIYQLLVERDPLSAEQIHPNNVRRVIRALEMADEGVSYAQQRSGFAQPTLVYSSLTFALTMDRGALYERIDRRVDAMMDQGLVDEVSALIEHGMSDALTSRQAIGYKEIIDALSGLTTMEEAVALIKQRSRRYAKRQLSWCRRDPRTIWIDMDAYSLGQAASFIVERIGA